jgi:hypothetical protein
MATGHAAGVIAALASERGEPPRSVAVPDIQRSLEAAHAILYLPDVAAARPA